MPVNFEVESKFRVIDARELERRIRTLGGQFVRRERQTDTYFSHPLRDFRRTDEALRVRVSNGSSCLTYKGPRADSVVKTRSEIEVHLAADSRGEVEIQTLLETLGFRLLANVAKSRAVYQLTYQGRLLSIGLDEVEQLGTYLEIESMATESEVDAARSVVEQLGRELELGEPTSDSYLQLVLAAAAAR